MSEMDEHFRHADFSRRSKGLQEQIWQSVRKRIEAQQACQERELTEEELLQVAAAGAPHALAPKPKKN